MRSVIFLAICIVTIATLNMIPYSVEMPNGSTLYSYGLLPGLASFSVICITIAFIALMIAYKNFKQPLTGKLTMQRIDFNMSHQRFGVLFWIAFILGRQFISHDALYLTKGITPYAITILLAFTLHEWIKKMLIKKMQPAFLSIDGNTIYIKTFAGTDTRSVDKLKAIKYQVKSNALLLEFKEGLENKHLFLTDYKMNELKEFVEAITQMRGEVTLVDESLKELWQYCK